MACNNVGHLFKLLVAKWLASRDDNAAAADAADLALLIAVKDKDAALTIVKSETLPTLPYLFIVIITMDKFRIGLRFCLKSLTSVK